MVCLELINVCTIRTCRICEGHEDFIGYRSLKWRSESILRPDHLTPRCACVERGSPCSQAMLHRVSGVLCMCHILGTCVMIQDDGIGMNRLRSPQFVLND